MKLTPFDVCLELVGSSPNGLQHMMLGRSHRSLNHFHRIPRRFALIPPAPRRPSALSGFEVLFTHLGQIGLLDLKPRGAFLLRETPAQLPDSVNFMLTR